MSDREISRERTIKSQSKLSPGNRDSRSDADVLAPLASPQLAFDESIGYQVRLTHRLIQRLLALKIERAGVTIGMWYFLRALWAEDGITQRELSERIGTQDPTTLSAIVQMEQRGIVRRERNMQDKRKINVFLTENGKALEASLLPIAIDIGCAAKSGMTQREADMLFGLLKQVQENIEGELLAAINESAATQPALRPRVSR